jgi:SAM-dependent methyltransferase
MSEWFEDESFWREMYPFMFSEERISLAAEQVDQVFKLVGFEGDAVLDLCCGPGRHTLILAQRGIRVTAVDRTEFLLNLARAEAGRLGLEVEFILEDMRQFVRPGAYHLVLSMFTSFGYFEDPGDDLRVLQNAVHSLRPGGAILIDLLGKEIVASRLQPTTSTTLPDGALLVQRHEVIDDWTRVRNEWILVKDGGARSFEFRNRLYSGQEMKDLLRRAGFGEVAVFGDLDGNEYGAQASRLIAVGRRTPDQ